MNFWKGTKGQELIQATIIGTPINEHLDPVPMAVMALDWNDSSPMYSIGTTLGILLSILDLCLGVNLRGWYDN